MFKQALFVLSWFLAGGLTFYALLLHGENSALAAELTALRQFEQRYQEQLAVNSRQRQEFETQIQQLQTNLTGAQAQMTNLSQALQEAREMMVPITDPAIELPTDTADLQ
jgi:chromosome segregation ATPase